MKILDLIRDRQSQQFDLHDRYLNSQMVRVLKTIGFDKSYVRAEGPYLFDAQGERYLDLLSGFGVFGIGRNHPSVIETLGEILHSELPHLVQMDVSLLSGLLAERLLDKLPGPLEKMFFCNSGTEAVEAAIKFSRCATGRSKIVYCDHAFHGLTLGALSLNGDHHFRDGFGPLLPDTVQIPFDDLAALEQALQDRDVAAFIVEPIQGHGVAIPSDDYLPEAARLCRAAGSLFVADEVQTGLGRTGLFSAVDHWGVEPDILLMAKALSGGFVPVGAVACRRSIFDAVFNRLDRAVVHGSTFSKNNLAMAAGLAVIDVIETEGLIENAARVGGDIVSELAPMRDEWEFVKDVRGKGMMIALEFGKPKSVSLRTAWKLLETANEGLFCQMITVPLFTRHRCLSQVAGHGMQVVKFIPPMTLTDDDRRWIVDGVRDVVADAHTFPGSIWDLGKTLAGQALKMKAGSD